MRDHRKLRAFQLADQLVTAVFRFRNVQAQTFLGADEFFDQRKRLIIFHEDGPTNSVTVREDEGSKDKLNRSFFINGKPDTR